MSTREADIARMEAAGKALFRQVCEAERRAGRACDLDDYPVRAEWSYLRSRMQADRQYQMYIDATFSLDGTEASQVVSTALIASGRTVVDCLEMFHNWTMDAVKDPSVLAVFRDKALRGEQAERDAAKDAAELAAEGAAAAAHVKTMREKTQEWLAKKVGFKARRDGVIGRKVQL